MIDIFSFLLFFIYALLILIILVYISPVIAGLFMIIIPVTLLFILPESAIDFLSIEQFSFADGFVRIQNTHILLLIWAGLVSVIAYAEFLFWYLVRGTESGVKQKEEKPNQIIDFFSKFIKILKGEKLREKS